MKPTIEALRDRLAAVLPDARLEVFDDSEQHRGHGGWREGGGTHMRVVMRAARLQELGRVERSRAVHKALSAELAGGVHALALDLGGPGEP